MFYLGGKPMAQVRQSTKSLRTETVEAILNRGIMVDAWYTVSAIGLRLMEIEVRVLIASLDTYINHADALGQTMLLEDAA
jgi:hypothetical protein